MLSALRRICRLQPGHLEAALVKQKTLTSRHASSLQCSTSYSTCVSTMQTAQTPNERSAARLLSLKVKFSDLLIPQTHLLSHRQSINSWLLAVTAAATVAAVPSAAQADEVAEIHPEEKACACLHSSTYACSRMLADKSVLLCSHGNYFHCLLGSAHSSSTKNGYET